MKEKISKEKILEYFERESGDRLLDRFEYAERVIFPAMEQYARQFLNPVVADNIFELIGQGVYKINCCELTIGGLADQVEGFVNQEVEKRIAERQLTDEQIERQFTTSHYHYEKGHYYKVRKDRIFGAKWYRDRLVSQKTEGGE